MTRTPETGTPDDDLRLRSTSPCIDAASNPWLPLDRADAQLRVASRVLELLFGWQRASAADADPGRTPEEHLDATLRVLDLRSVSDFTDYFLIASGSSQRQVQAIAEGIEPGERRRQVQDDPPHRALDPHRELQQPLAQRGDLRVGTGGARGPAPQLLEQHVRRQGQQHAELVGQEPLATRAVQLQPVMQFLQPVLHIAPPAVELVDRLRGVGQVGHHEAGDCSSGPARDAAPPRP